MIEVDECKGSTNFLKICQLQSQIHQKLFQKNHIFDKIDDQKQIVKLRNLKATNIQAISRCLFTTINITNV